MNVPVTSLVLTLATALLAAAAEDPPAAVVRGIPVTREDLHTALADRYGRRTGGGRLLERFVTEWVAADEMARRGITVTAEEVVEKVEEARLQAAEQLKRYGEKEVSLDEFLQASGTSLREFRAQTSQYLALQKMARQDLGTSREVSPAQLDIWLRDLRRRRKVIDDPAVLGKDEVARVGGEPLSRLAFGKWLTGVVRRPDLFGVVQDLVFRVDVADRAAREKVSLSLEEVEREISRLRREFMDQPGIEGSGITFEVWLGEKQGMTLDELRSDPGFLTNLLARRVAGRALTEETVEREWADNPARYGETARIRRILVRGEDRPSAFGASARPMLEAKRIADKALDEAQSGTPFEEVARRWTEEVPPEGPRGRLLEVTPVASDSLLPQNVLDAVFAGNAGDVLGPLKAIDGWHIVRVVSRRPAPAFEEIRDAVRGDLEAEAVSDWRLRLRDDEGVEIHPDFRD